MSLVVIFLFFLILLFISISNYLIRIRIDNLKIRAALLIIDTLDF